jgi:hypothetical protein
VNSDYSLLLIFPNDSIFFGIVCIQEVISGFTPSDSGSM